MKVKMIFMALLAVFLIFSCQKENSTAPADENIHPQQDIPWPSLADSPWPIPFGNVQRTGRSKYTGPQKGVVEWFFTEYTMGGTYASPVIGEDGTIYVFTNMKFYAINPDGTLKWKINTRNTTHESVMIGAGDIIYLTFGSVKLDPNYSGYVDALDANRNTIWEHRTVGMPFSYSASIGLDGTIYFTDLGGYLHALNSDGSLKWKTRGIGGLRSTWSLAHAFSPDGTTLYVAGEDSTMNAINAQTGDVIWQLPTGHNIETAPLVDNEGNVYFFYGIPGEIHYVISATKDGEIRWKFTHKELYTFAYYSGMHLDKDGNIYFCSGHEFYSLDYDGNLRWKAPFLAWGYAPVSPILGDRDGNIYLALEEEYVLAFDQDGNRKFECKIPELGGFLTMGALSSNGRLYLVGEKTLYCIK